MSWTCARCSDLRLMLLITGCLAIALMVAPAAAYADGHVEDADESEAAVEAAADTEDQAAEEDAALPEPEVKPTMKPEPRAALASHAGDHPFSSRDIRFRVSVEPSLSEVADGDARMALFSMQMDTIFADIFHLGVAGFGSLAGEYGGFFGAGLHGMLRYPLSDPVWLELGGVAGAGGGGGAPVGSGLFVKPRAGLFVDLEELVHPLGGIALGVSHLIFPNGDIRGTHLEVTLESSFDALYLPGIKRLSLSAADLDQNAYGVGRRLIRTTGHAYFLIDSKTRAGADLGSKQAMMGFEFREYFGGGFFGTLEPRALLLAGTNRPGFLELTMGGGYELALDMYERYLLYASAGIGGAGGGGVATGGGLFLRGSLGFDIDIPGPFHVGIDGGIQTAPLGDFTAVSTGLRLGLNQEGVSLSRNSARRFRKDDQIESALWRLRLGNLSYFNVSKGDDDGLMLHLLGVKADYFPIPEVYLMAQAASTYSGPSGTGAFSLGTLGVGYHSPSWNGLSGAVELRGGAAGGGGLALGRGILLQPMAGLTFEMTQDVSLEMLGGWMVAPTGELHAPSVEVGLIYSVATPQLRAR